MTDVKHKPRIAVYAGSFDPPTNGHQWVINQGAHLFDKLLIAIGINPEKKSYFSQFERLAMMSQMASIYPNVQAVVLGNEYLVDFAASHKANYILRGIRSRTDFAFENTMRQFNGGLKPWINSVFLIPPASLINVSSSTIKGLIGPKGWQEVVKKFVPENVFEAISNKHKEKTDVSKVRPISTDPLFFRATRHSGDDTKNKKTD